MKITEEERKQIVNEAVEQDEKELELLQCQICLETAYKPMECSIGCTGGFWC